MVLVSSHERVGQGVNRRFEGPGNAPERPPKPKALLLGDVSSVLCPFDLWGLSLDHVLELGDWIPKRQSPMQLVSRWNANQARNAPVPCPRHGRATGSEHPSSVEVPYAQGVGDKGGILQGQLCIYIRESNGPWSMKSH